MKFGINTLLWTAAFDLDHLDLLPQFKAWGFDAVEIARFDFEGFPARLIREAAHNEGLETLFCSALTGELSLISDDRATRRRAHDFIRRGAETAAELGSPVMVGPYLGPVGQLVGRRPNDDEWQWAVDELRALTPALRECDVTLALEPLNRFETYFLNTAADAARLCDQVHDPYVGVLFDTFHANIEEKRLGDAIRTLGDHVAHVHVCENDRGAPGSGHIDWAGVFGALADVRYRDYCVIESFGSNIPEIATAAAIWRDLAESSEALAREGLSFLREAEAASRRARSSAAVAAL